MTRKIEPFIWLQSFEPQGVASCGCRLVSDYRKSGDPAFIQCKTHERAGEMLEALRWLLTHDELNAPKEMSAALRQDVAQARKIIMGLPYPSKKPYVCWNCGQSIENEDEVWANPKGQVVDGECTESWHEGCLPNQKRREKK